MKVDTCSTFSKACDIYAMGISMFEILSDKSSAWDSFNLPDQILKFKIESGMRPDINHLQTLYADLSTMNHISGVIEKCWDSDEINRPDARQVSALCFLLI